MLHQKSNIRKWVVAALIACVLFGAMAGHVFAGPTCQFWRSGKGVLYIRLNSDPGGDGAVYVYVNGEQVTYTSAKGRWFYVPSERGDTVRGYNSQYEMQCSL